MLDAGHELMYNEIKLEHFRTFFPESQCFTLVSWLLLFRFLSFGKLYFVANTFCSFIFFQYNFWSMSSNYVFPLLVHSDVIPMDLSNWVRVFSGFLVERYFL